MFSSAQYDPNILHSHFQSCVEKVHPEEAALSARLLTERELLLATLQMLTGLQNEVFKLTPEGYFDILGVKVTLTHVCRQSVDRQLRQCIQFANSLNYIRKQSKRIILAIGNYASSGLLKSIICGIHQTEQEFSVFFAEMLSQLYRQASSILIESSEQDLRPLTLLSLCGRIEAHEEVAFLISSVLSLLSALLPLKSPKQVAVFVKSALDIYYDRSQEMWCRSESMHYLQLLFSPVVLAYLRVIATWLKADQCGLDAIKDVGFFIDVRTFLDNAKVVHNKIKVVNQSLRANTLISYDIQSLPRQNMFLEADAIINEAVPKMLQPFATLLLALGKTITFIFLYFNENQANILRKYLQLDSFLEQTILQFKQPESKGIFCIHRTATRRFSSIASKMLKAQPKKLEVLPTPIASTNPYRMAVETSGVFGLAPKPKPHLLQNRRLSSSRMDHPKKINSVSSPIMQFTNIFSTAVDSIKQKCLNFLDASPTQEFAQLPIESKERIWHSIEQATTGLKSFMLLGQGDFIEELLLLAYELFDDASEEIPKHIVHGHIQEAIRNSNARYLATNITARLSFIFLTVEARKDEIVKGWTVFSLFYKPQKPVDCLFTPSLIYSYAEIFNFVFNIKRCEYAVKSLWRDLRHEVGQKEKSLQNSQYRRMNRVHGLRNAMHKYISGVLQYLMRQFEADFEQFLLEIRDCCEVLAIIDANKRLLERLGKITVNDTILCNCLLLLIDLVDRFLVTLNEFQESQIDIIQQRFRNVVQMTMRINVLSETLDFNLHFDL